MIEIIPGINEDKFSEVVRKIELVTPHTQWVQIDFFDGTLAPRKTFMDLEKFAPVIESHPTLSFEAHVQVSNPEKYLSKLTRAGFKRIIAHAECVDFRRFLEEAAYESVETGIALDGPSEFELIEPFTDGVDCVLFMLYEIGESGRPIMDETLEKVRRFKESFPELPLEVDGGITDKTIHLPVAAGATRVVSTSYIFNHPHGVAAAVAELNHFAK
jgi:ribulose-phosphate 3-epimerase